MAAFSSVSLLARDRASQGGALVRGVMPGSPAARGGLLAGDVITHVDGYPVSDFLDFYVASFSRGYGLTVERDGARRVLAIDRGPQEETGVEIDTGTPMLCNNRCIFCFVDQLPSGLRQDLYLKDEDYRLSFLHGNYLTLTNLSPRDEARILAMRLSPLYVSVHSTDAGVRARLLGGGKKEGILAIIDRLGRGGIRFHAQIVVVPGINDGRVLGQTFEDLSQRHDIILSLSVVPVGLTCHRAGLEPLEPVSRSLAREVVGHVNELNARMRETVGRGFAYASDELVLMADELIPAASYYDDYPQIENGVGLVRTLMDSSEGLEVPPSVCGRNLVFATGRLAAPVIEEATSALRQKRVGVKVIAIENSLLGPTVTVSGLLAGKDIIRAVGQAPRCDAVVVPPNVVNSDNLTLDDVTIREMTDALGLPVVVGGYDLMETVKGLDVVFNEE